MPVFPCEIVQETQAVVDADRSTLHIYRDGVSAVRLYEAHEPSQLIWEWFEPTVRLVGKLVLIPANEELEFVCVGGRVLPSVVEDGGAIDASVQSSAKLIEELAKQEREQGRDGLHANHANGTCPVAVHISAEGVEVFLIQRIPFLGELLSVSIRPL